MTYHRQATLTAHGIAAYLDPHTNRLWALEEYTLHGVWGATWVDVSKLSPSAFRAWLGY
jgi:hypothetical protein